MVPPVEADRIVGLSFDLDALCHLSQPLPSTSRVQLFPEDFDGTAVRFNRRTLRQPVVFSAQEGSIATSLTQD